MPTYRALVVDDEATVRRYTTIALSREGFQCEVADDGLAAGNMLQQANYDVLITDLHMPNTNGHALVVDVLKQAQRPLVVVMTGVTEPKLAKDLVVRGVDDIVFKPVVFGMFAAKIRALVDQKRKTEHEFELPVKACSAPPTAMGTPVETEANPGPNAIALPQFQEQLAGISRLMPVSQAALNVYNLTVGGTPSIGEIAEIMQLDPSLAAETLRLANSTYFNSSGRPVGTLNDAIFRVGQKHVGDLALSVGAMGLLTQEMLPWMDMNLARKRSLSAGMAVKMLIEQGQHDAVADRLWVCGLMHNMGRITLGMLFPEHYEALVHRCNECREPLAQLEQQMFPESPGTVLAHLLENWNLPSDICQPLKFLSEDFATLAQLPDPMRTKAELVKLAVVVAQLAVGSWEPWDIVEFPSELVLRRLRVTDLGDVIDRIREGVEDLAQLSASTSKSQTSRKPVDEPFDDHLTYYWNQSSGACDFLALLFPAMGIQAIPYKSMSADSSDDVLVNYLGRPLSSIIDDLKHRQGQKLTIVLDKICRDQQLGYGHVVEIPASFMALREACREA